MTLMMTGLGFSKDFSFPLCFAKFAGITIYEHIFAFSYLEDEAESIQRVRSHFTFCFTCLSWVKKMMITT